MRPSFALAGPVAVIATVGAMFWALAMIWVRKMGPGESHEAVVLHFSWWRCHLHPAGVTPVALAQLDDLAFCLGPASAADSARSP